MSLDIWSRDDIRNVILAANACAPATEVVAPDEAPVELADSGSAYQAGYEAALAAMATAFGIPLAGKGRLRSPGVVVPGARLAVSYRAAMTLERLLRQREEWRS